MISFKRILIQNFKRYNRIEIRPKSDRGLFVFLGKNYLGKSTFLNALCWCLYNDQPFRESIEKNVQHENSLLNEDAKRQNQYEEVRVELEIEDDGREYLFVRSWRPSQDSRFQVMIKNNQDWSPLPNPTVIVETLLPKNLREYFIFAGEDAESLFSPGYETKLKNGVWRVSNIEVLDRLLQHIESVYSELQREVARRGDSSSVKEAVEKKTKLDDERIKGEERVKHLTSEIEKLEKTRGEYLLKIKETAAYTEKIKRREILERRRGDIKKSLTRYSKDTNDLITENAPFLYMEGILDSIKDQLTTDEEAGTLPPSIRSEFITELLKKKKCICGRNINHDDGSELKLKKLLEQVLPADQRAPLLEDRYPIQEILKNLSVLNQDIDRLNSDKAKLLHEGDQVELELRNISEELAGAPETEISGLEDGIKKLEQNITSDRREEAILTHQLNQIASQIKELDEQIRKESSKKEHLQQINSRLDVLESSRDCTNFVRERITDRVRRVLSKNTENYFKELFWDQSEYESIEFTEDYKLRVVKRGFSEPSTEFSSGEKKVLGIATLRAIADLSGFSGVPIFFDAPLTKLGPEIETNVLSMLPRLAPDKQLFIFNLDVEKIIEFSRNLPKGHVYELRKDPKNQNSTIIHQINV